MSGYGPDTLQMHANQIKIFEILKFLSLNLKYAQHFWVTGHYYTSYPTVQLFNTRFNTLSSLFCEWMHIVNPKPAFQSTCKTPCKTIIYTYTDIY